MAKSKSIFEIFGNEVVKGLGRGTGYNISKTTTNYVKSKILDDNNPFRRHMSNLKMLGTFNGNKNKLNATIDMFYKEYSGTTAMFQKDIYLDRDIDTIDFYLENLERYVDNDTHRLQYHLLTRDWDRIKNRIKEQK